MSGDSFPRFVAATVQAASVFLDREATIEKACSLIDETSREGARLIVFPETWVPVYPYWIWSAKPISGHLFRDLYLNAVEVPSPATDRLSSAARKAGAYVVIGVNERDGGTLYNTLLTFGPDGALVGHRRKVMPTHMERTMWGWGDGSGLRVHETEIGRLGGLICWEHEMSLVKYALYAQHEEVHAAVWPAMTVQNAHIDFGCRQYAYEGRCFVVVSCGYFSEAMVPQQYGLKGYSFDANGGSAIIGPNGDYLAGPLYGRESILYAEIDLNTLPLAKYHLDVAGHYARPDVVQLLLNDTPQPVVRRSPPGGHGVAAQLRALAAEIDSARDGVDGELVSELEELLQRHQTSTV